LNRKFQSSLVADLNDLAQKNKNNLQLLEEIQYELYTYRTTTAAKNLLLNVTYLINEIETQKRLERSLANKDTEELIKIVKNYKEQITKLQQEKKELEQTLSITAGDCIKLKSGERAYEIEILKPQDLRTPHPPAVISPNSELAGAVLGYSFEDEIELPNGNPAQLLEIRKPNGLILLYKN